MNLGVLEKKQGNTYQSEKTLQKARDSDCKNLKRHVTGELLYGFYYYRMFVISEFQKKMEDTKQRQPYTPIPKQEDSTKRPM